MDEIKKGTDANEALKKVTMRIIAPLLSLYETISITEMPIDNFILLDDNDLWTSLKVWSANEDIILSTLSKGIINRNLFKVEVSSTPIPKEKKADIISNICKALSISKKDARYFLASSSLENNMYKKEDDSIEILYKDGTTKDISQASDMLNISLLSRKIKKYYTCYYRFENVKY